jgi:hypothetical protein
MRRKFFLAASIAALISAHARADFFVGAAGGISDWPNAIACPPTAGSCDKRGGTWLVRGGYMFLPYLGIEARYVDLGRATFSVPSVTNGMPTGTDVRLDSKGGAIGAVAALPVSDAFAFVAVAGATRLKTTLEIPETTTPLSEGVAVVAGFHSEATKTNPYFGLGVDYRVAPNTSVGVEATRYRLGGSDNVDTLTASLTFHFR